ncbi:hypothetical protein FOL47_005505, partial [Perkinsus chesapeaki]
NLILRSQFVYGLPQGTAKALVLAKYEDVLVDFEALVTLAKDHVKASRFDGSRGAAFGASAMRMRAGGGYLGKGGKGAKGQGRNTGKGKGASHEGANEDRTRSPRSNMRCWECNERGHLRRDCPRRSNASGAHDQ